MRGLFSCLAPGAQCRARQRQAHQGVGRRLAHLAWYRGHRWSPVKGNEILMSPGANSISLADTMPPIRSMSRQVFAAQDGRRSSSHRGTTAGILSLDASVSVKAASARSMAGRPCFNSVSHAACHPVTRTSTGRALGRPVAAIRLFGSLAYLILGGVTFGVQQLARTGQKKSAGACNLDLVHALREHKRLSAEYQLWRCVHLDASL